MSDRRVTTFRLHLSGPGFPRLKLDVSRAEPPRQAWPCSRACWRDVQIGDSVYLADRRLKCLVTAVELLETEPASRRRWVDSAAEWERTGQHVFAPEDLMAGGWALGKRPRHY